MQHRQTHAHACARLTHFIHWHNARNIAYACIVHADNHSIFAATQFACISNIGDMWDTAWSGHIYWAKYFDSIHNKIIPDRPYGTLADAFAWLRQDLDADGLIHIDGGNCLWEHAVNNMPFVLTEPQYAVLKRFFVRIGGHIDKDFLTQYPQRGAKQRISVTEETTMKITIYSKDDCPNCVIAERLVANMGYTPAIVKVGVDIDRDDFLQRFNGVKQLPQMEINDIYIGGLAELQQYVRDTATQHMDLTADF